MVNDMDIIVDNKILELEFKTLQIEITGRCNLKCKHCRASYDPLGHISIDLIDKFLDFSEAKDGVNITISGGEPFLHPNILGVLRRVKCKKPEELVITTNGFHLKDEILDEIERINFNKITFQISLDSANEKTHDAFRGKPSSFVKALNSVGKLSKRGFFTSIRSTLTPKTINESDDICEIALKNGAKRISFGTVVPSGNALSDSSLFITKQQKSEHFQKFFKLKHEYHHIAEIVTEDPLKSVPKDSPWHDVDKELFGLEGYIPGCDAGIMQLNMYSNGDITPCALFNKVITNLNEKTVAEARDEYSSSPVIMNLLMKNLTGKCNGCPDFKRCGGGCRAVAYGHSGNYLSDDPTCIRNIN